LWKIGQRISFSMSFQFEEGSGFSAFALYNAIKLHMTSTSYDFFKYGGKTNVNKTSFEKNKAKFSFYKLSRKYKLDELKYYYVSNFLEKDVKWVGDIAGPDGEDVYKKWQTRNQKLTYQFEQDIIHLFDSSGNFLYVDNGNYPYLLTEMMHGDVMVETVAILNDIMGFFPMWDKKIQDDLIWPNWKLKIEKYTPFIRYDKAKFKAIVKEHYGNQ
jgi:hypothetical protein